MAEEKKNLADDHQESETGQNTTRDPKDWGFGTSFSRKSQRLINHDGSFNVRRTHGQLLDFHLYHYLITIPWVQFWFILLAFYILFNALFAGLYIMAGIENLQGIPQTDMFLDEFLHAFYFSVQTFTTVGYGSVSPQGHMANLIASLEAMIGLVGFAFATGLLYGRFARPNANVWFSKNALIAPYKDINAFMFRIVNGRRNQLIELQAEVMLSWFDPGRHKRMFAVLNLERKRISLFPLSWTVVHPIDEDSPIYNWDQEYLERVNPEFMILIRGYDETFAQEVHARSSYKFLDCVWGAKFVKMFDTDESGITTIRLDELNRYHEAKLNPLGPTS